MRHRPLLALPLLLGLALVAASCGADSGAADGGEAVDTASAPPPLTTDVATPTPDVFIHLGGDDTTDETTSPADADPPLDVPPAGPCTGRADCPPGFSCCEDGGCRFNCGGGSTGCRSDADCDDGETCCADGGCRVDCEGLAPVCNTDNDCPQGETCCEDHECRLICDGGPVDANCTVDRDCLPGQRCIEIGSSQVCLTTCTSETGCTNARTCQPFGGLVGQHIANLPEVCACTTDTQCDGMLCCTFPFADLKTCMVSCPEGVLF